jgi:hypothetical protein
MRYAEEFLETLVKETQQLQKPLSDRIEKRRSEEAKEGYTRAEVSCRHENGRHISYLDQSRRDRSGDIQWIILETTFLLWWTTVCFPSLYRLPLTITV